FVRQKTEKKPRVKATPLAPKSKTAAGMMMSKNVKAAPKEKRGSGPERRPVK
ncbi:MAG: hypothetical protein JWO38_7725, partial [Gemmataceae bacterium]|nr:hypothetical protein [Gemmataceae bacterium]